MLQSLPSWERGLKFFYQKHLTLYVHVAPLVGAWIEIFRNTVQEYSQYVAPLVGAWIEISLQRTAL